ncbi:MAG: hypothetical protein SAJ12_02210 [Jaaginema sp. PMC 1079.18]|nr:hypothetical protein [Jaaginema sp. PMC 1080.18]MEC4849802.1 hypothetical protein [Jaaginema sp. PMC 1079.18]MEC4866884.1 hypothetical protein [Jaaginema sp. PMC 1078.18]
MPTLPRLPLETLNRLLKTLLRLPPNWWRLMAILVMLSLFQIAWNRETGWQIQIVVSQTTLLLLLITWLPVFLQVFALVGGAIRTPGAEFTSPGLDDLLRQISPKTKDEIVGAMNVVLENAATTPEDRREALQAHQEINQQYRAPLNKSDAKTELMRLAERYNQLSSLPSGTRQHFLQEAVAGAMRSLCLKADLDDTEIRDYLQSRHPGLRLVGLSAIDDLAHITSFNGILDRISQPMSPFEQMNALSAMQRLIPVLNPTQQQRLKDTLLEQRNHNIKPQSDRWEMSEELLANLKAVSP